MERDITNILDQVKAYAEEAHGSQRRKYTGEPYIAHPVRVMETVKVYNNGLPVLAAALLHDVIEDTPVGKRELGNFLSTIMDKENAARTLELVDELTDVYVKTDYPTMNRRARRTREVDRLSSVSSDAQTVKYADIIDNVADIVRQDNDFALVYIRECKQMLLALDKGDPQLYRKATETVDRCMREFWAKSNVKAL